MNNLDSIRSLAKNSFFMLLARATVPLCSFIITVCVARYLGPLEFGQYSIVYKFFILFRIFCFLGLYQLIIREIARNKNHSNEYFINSLFIGICSSLFFYILMLVLVYFMNYERIIFVGLVIVGISLFFDTVAFFSEAVFVAHQKFIYIFYVTLFTNIIFIVASLTAIMLDCGFIYLLSIAVIVSIISSVARVFFVNFYLFRLSWGINMDLCKSILKAIPIFSLISIVSSTILALDIIILSKLRSSLEVGWYSPSIKLSSLGFLFVYNFADALFPIISVAYQTAKEKFMFFCEKSIKYLSIVLLPLTLELTFLSEKIIQTFFGNTYINSIPALKILLWAPVPLSFSYIFSRILIASNKEKLDLITLLLGFIFSFILLIIFTYVWGYIGTSLALLLSVSLISIIHYLFISRLVLKINLIKLLFKPSLFTILALLILQYLKKINLYLACCVSIIVYTILLFAFRVIEDQDIWIIKQALRRNVTPLEGGDLL